MAPTRPSADPCLPLGLDERPERFKAYCLLALWFQKRGKSTAAGRLG